MPTMVRAGFAHNVCWSSNSLLVVAGLPAIAFACAASPLSAPAKTLHPMLRPPAAACVCYVRALGTPIYNFHMRPLPGPPASGASEQQQQQQGQQQQDRQPPQQPQPQGASGSGAAGGSGAARVGSAAMAAAAAAAPGTSWELVYTPSDQLLEAGGLVAVSEGGRLLRHGLVLGEEGLEPAEGADASDT